MTTYPELVAKARTQWDRGLITQAEYESEIMYLATAEVNRLKPYRVTFMWNETDPITVITHCESLEELVQLLDDYVVAYGLSLLKTVDISGGSYVKLFMSASENTCTITVDVRQKF